MLVKILSYLPSVLYFQGNSSKNDVDDEICDLEMDFSRGDRRQSLIGTTVEETYPRRASKAGTESTEEPSGDGLKKPEAEQ